MAHCTRNPPTLLSYVKNDEVISVFYVRATFLYTISVIFTIDVYRLFLKGNYFLGFIPINILIYRFLVVIQHLRESSTFFRIHLCENRLYPISNSLEILKLTMQAICRVTLSTNLNLATRRIVCNLGVGSVNLARYLPLDVKQVLSLLV